jgi:hypothetical protein
LLLKDWYDISRSGLVKGRWEVKEGWSWILINTAEGMIKSLQRRPITISIERKGNPSELPKAQPSISQYFVEASCPIKVTISIGNFVDTVFSTYK